MYANKVGTFALLICRALSFWFWFQVAINWINGTGPIFQPFVTAYLFALEAHLIEVRRGLQKIMDDKRV